MKYDITTKWYRTWRERHPVLDEWLGFLMLCLLIFLIALLIFY